MRTKISITPDKVTVYVDNVLVGVSSVSSVADAIITTDDIRNYRDRFEELLQTIKGNKVVSLSLSHFYKSMTRIDLLRNVNDDDGIINYSILVEL